jgi:hypothetical protein
MPVKYQKRVIELSYFSFFRFDHILIPQRTPIPIKKIPRPPKKPAKKILIFTNEPIFSPPK